MSTAELQAGTSPVQLPVHPCPVCHQLYKTGDLACPHCRVRLVGPDQTGKLELSQVPITPVTQSQGPARIPTDDTLICFEIDQRLLVLPPLNSLVIGRASTSGTLPDVNLGAFHADEFGVSRQHIRLTRDVLVYVEDLQSTNGTYINGKRLTPHLQYMLTHGDDLRLGNLRAATAFHQQVKH